MERKIRKIKRVINYVALTLPEMEKNNFNLEVYGDQGYQYKGRINSFEGNIPHLLIPLRGDSQLFVHINTVVDKTKEVPLSEDDNSNKKYISFIPVPKRYQDIKPKNEKTNVVDVK